jgi:hypothetical protein
MCLSKFVKICQKLTKIDKKGSFVFPILQNQAQKTTSTPTNWKCFNIWICVLDPKKFEKFRNENEKLVFHFS